MSQILIQQYLNELSTLRRVSGTTRESVVSEAFKTLLKDWGRSRDLIFVPQYEYQTLQKKVVYPDGALVHELRVPFGYWEAKDEEDDLDEEIEKKFRRGYPQDNIIFEDSREAILIQDKQQVMRCEVENAKDLHRLLDLYFGYEREEIAEFRKAIEKFKGDLPAVLAALRDMIDKAERDNPTFRRAADKFLEHARDTINPNVTAADVREMLIQHILTEEIFSQVFGNAEFHRKNNVARELYALEETFFTGGLKQKTLAGLRPYYAAIKSAAALVTGHHEKQKFLKIIYENFYKVYDKKKADRLGVVYTPNEIVRFMIESADWLCQKHFHRSLIDKNVEILDPAAGTGTFITELIEHFRGQPAKLRTKYLEELHANEVAIQPYYVANLNIEASYATLTGDFEEYPNLCFVDTLDNTAALRAYKGQQGNLFGALSEENIARIKRQNKKKISVIIGNPPYNVNQLNENENNKNREYPEIDDRISETYIAASHAQMTKLYDMYVRFFRWASDRVDENGIVAFVTNRSFIEAQVFDGFRRKITDEFNDVYLIDLGGDVRADPRISGTKHNVFGIQTGVTISLMVKRARAKGCRIYYARRPQLETAEEKLAYLGSSSLADLPMEEVRPDRRNNWINLADSDFGSFIPVADRGSKSARNRTSERAVFRLYTLGINSGRDDWMFDFSRSNLTKKVRFLVDFYHEEVRRLPLGKNAINIDDFVKSDIKWTIELKLALQRRETITVKETEFVTAVYRPFVKTEYCFNRRLTKRVFRIPECQPTGREDNRYILFPASGATKRVPFCVFATDRMPDLNFFTPDPAHAVVRYRYATDGSSIDNITDWGLQQFRAGYSEETKRPITKDSIFHYVYAVLHDPIYREKYVQNLKREFPRIPFYADFWHWTVWGERLMALHIGYETVEPWPLERIDTPDDKSRKAGLAPKALLKADKDASSTARRS